MSFYSTQKYPNRKDWRKAGPDDPYCQSHGPCGACQIKRKVKAKRQALTAHEQIAEWRYGETALMLPS